MNADDEELLARALTDGLDPGAPEWKKALAKDPTLALRREELVELLRVLQRTGLDERTSLARARASFTDKDVELVRRVIGARSAASSARPWWRRRTVTYAAAAALVAVGIFVAFNRRSESKRDDRVFLGDPRYHCVEPTLEVGDARLFRWTGEHPPGGRFVVHAFAVDASGAVLGSVLQSERCIDNTWKPTASELEQLPERFRWEVEVLRADGEHYALSAQQLARRSAP